MSRNGDDFSYDMDKDGLHHCTPIWFSPFDKLNCASKKDISYDKKCDEENRPFDVLRKELVTTDAIKD